MQLRLIPLYRRAPFGPGSWSFTFASAAVAIFALQLIGREHPPGAAAWAWTVLSLITIIIGAIAARTLLALGRGQFPTPSRHHSCHANLNFLRSPTVLVSSSAAAHRRQLAAAELSL